MQRASFYGQTSCGSYRASLPPGTFNSTQKTPLFYDSWENKAKPFEQRLKKEIDVLKLESKELSDTVLKAQESKTMTSQQQEELNIRYQALEKAQKMLTILVDQMKKGMEAIVANFR